MTEEVKNLFKHEIPFRLRENSIRERDMGIQDISFYQSKLIIYPLYPLVEEDIYDSKDIYYKVKSFLHYLASKHIATKHEGYMYIGSLFDRDYKKLVEVEVNPETTNYGDVLIFGEPKFKKVNPVIIYSNSIEINIDVYGNYLKEIPEEIPEEVESENESDESEEEDNTTVYISEPFYSDQCVVCLSEKPELLFVNCLHCCVCLKCEKTESIPQVSIM